MSRPNSWMFIGAILLTQVLAPAACKWASADIRTESPAEQNIKVQSNPAAPLAKTVVPPDAEPPQEVIQEIGKDAKVVSEPTPPAPSESGAAEAEDPTVEEKPGAVALKMAY